MGYAPSNTSAYMTAQKAPLIYLISSNAASLQSPARRDTTVSRDENRFAFVCSGSPSNTDQFRQSLPVPRIRSVHFANPAGVPQRNPDSSANGGCGNDGDHRLDLFG